MKFIYRDLSIAVDLYLSGQKGVCNMNNSKLKEFETILESIKVPSNMEIEQQAQLVQPISNLVEAMLPSRLYRFRKCSERNFDAFYKNQIWVSRGSDVNDDYDTSLYYDDKKIKDWLKILCDDQSHMKIFNYFKNTKDVPEFLKLFCLAPEKEIEKRFDAVKQLSYEDVKKFVLGFQEYIQNNLSEKLKHITLLIQQGVKFACFSENINSVMMWGHYADSNTGFALGYDFKQGRLNDCIECCKLGVECFYPMLCHIYPIIYKNKRYDATEYAIYMFQYWLFSDILSKGKFINNHQLINSVIPCPDNLTLSKIAIHKSLEYKPEREWRLFCSNNRPGYIYEAHSYINKEPVAIYLGRKISSINEKILKSIAKEKGIECYKMEFSKSQTYKLRPVKQNYES